MRKIWLPVLASLTLAGCVVVHTTEKPSDWLEGVDVHVDEDAMEGLCLHEGRGYSPGAMRCMGERRMRCDAGVWVDAGACND